ncbi:MAG: ABC transporter permease [Acidobacteriia bacterium]|nr:ABC transporter permease [Terriglobia bacterium]
MTAQALTGEARRAVPPRLARWYVDHERAVLGTLVTVLFLVFWEGLSQGWWADALRPLVGPAADRLLIRPIFISSPMRIAAEAWRMFFITGEIWSDLRYSAMEYALGLGLAIAVGMPLGLAAGWYRHLSYAVEPFLSAFNATPQIALLPLMIIWVGLGLATKVLIIFLLAVLPIAISAQAAVRTTDARLLKVAHSFGASEAHLFRTIILPSAVPYLLAGLRLAVGRAMIGIVVGEIFGSAIGIGAMINRSGLRFATDKVFVGVLVIAVTGMLLAELVRQIERRVEAWRPPV